MTEKCTGLGVGIGFDWLGLGLVLGLAGLGVANPVFVLKFHHTAS